MFQIGDLGLRGKRIPIDVIRQVIELQADTRADVRSEAAHTLGKIVPPPEVVVEVAACLRRLLDDGNDRVRSQAQASIETLGLEIEP
ncbi:MAG: hypothetical protein GY724_16375 [Actinomycetia bacterium]|nr:hypothetical protein [Actinomycetes bacterium]